MFFRAPLYAYEAAAVMVTLNDCSAYPEESEVGMRSWKSTSLLLPAPTDVDSDTPVALFILVQLGVVSQVVVQNLYPY